MANDFADYLEAKLIDFLLRGQSFTPSGTLAIALTTDVPTDASYNEVANAFSYARQSVVSSLTSWSRDSSTAGNAYNNNIITFPQAVGGDWGNVSGAVITDSPVYGVGNVYFKATLTSPQYIAATNQFVIPVSGVQIQFS